MDGTLFEFEQEFLDSLGTRKEDFEYRSTEQFSKLYVVARWGDYAGWNEAGTTYFDTVLFMIKMSRVQCMSTCNQFTYEYK